MQIRRALPFFLFLCPFCLLAFDLPQESGLTRTLLSSGVQAWVRENAIPPRFTAVKIVGRTAAGFFTYAKECQDENLEEIEEFFSDYVSQIGENLDSLGVIAVGDFSKTKMESLIARYFASVPLSPLKGAESDALMPAVSIYDLEDVPRNFLTLLYPMPLSSLSSSEDLKKMWALLCLQKIVESRLKNSFKDTGAEWVTPLQVPFQLPSRFFMSQLMYTQQSPLELLADALLMVQDVRRKGLNEEELAAVKLALRKNILSLSQGFPDSTTLANYFAAHFDYPLAVPEYATFVSLSPTLLSEISLDNMHDLLKHSFKDEGRRVEIRSSVPVDQEEVKETLDLFKSGDLLLDLRSQEDEGKNIVEGGFQGDPFTRLPITPDEAETIWKIIDTVANNNVLKLGLKKGDLERKGKKVHHVHPLKFLSTIFSDPHLRKCMKDVRDSYFKWSGFMGGLEERMNEEWEKNNLYPHVNGFSALVKAHPDQVRMFIQARDWEGLVKYLIRVE